MASESLAALGVRDQVLEGVDVAADVEDAALAWSRRAGGLSSLLLRPWSGLDDVERQALEGLGRDLGAGLSRPAWWPWSGPRSSSRRSCRRRPRRAAATGILGSSLGRRRRSQTAPWGSSSSSRSVTPTFSLSFLLASSSLAATSSLQRLQRRVGPELAELALPERLAELGGVVDLDEDDGRVGEDLLRGRPRPGPGPPTSDRPARPSQPARARRKAARIGIRIAETPFHATPRLTGGGHVDHRRPRPDRSGRSRRDRGTDDPARHDLGADRPARPIVGRSDPVERPATRPGSPAVGASARPRRRVGRSPRRRRPAAAGGAGRGSGSRCWGCPCRTRTPRGCGGSP